MQEEHMNDRKLPIRVSSAWRDLTRRRFIRNATGAGAVVVLGSAVRQAEPHGKHAKEEEAAHRECPAVPRPIPHITSPPGLHFFFPGPVDASPVTSPNTGH